MNQPNLDPESEPRQPASNAGGKEELSSAAFSSLSQEARLEKLNDIIARNDIDAFVANISTFIFERCNNEELVDPFQDYCEIALAALAESQPERLKSLLLDLDRESSLLLLEPLLVEDLTKAQSRVLAEIYDQLAPRLSAEDRSSLANLLCFSAEIAWMESHSVEAEAAIVEICEDSDDEAMNLLGRLLKLENLDQYPKTAAIVTREFGHLPREERLGLILKMLWHSHSNKSGLSIFDDTGLFKLTLWEFEQSLLCANLDLLRKVSGISDESAKQGTSALLFDAVTAGTKVIFDTFEEHKPSQLSIQIALLGSWHTGTESEGRKVLYDLIHEHPNIDRARRDSLCSYLAIKAIELSRESLVESESYSRERCREAIEEIVKPMKNLGPEVVNNIIKLLGESAGTELVQRYRRCFIENKLS